MTLDYISGFFDADGSITLSTINGGNNRTVKVDFTNTKKSILLEIQKYLEDNYGINTYLSTKPSKKDNWSESYALSATYRNGYKLCELLKSHHPIKKFRIDVVLKYYNEVTKRNGKYTEKQLQRKKAFERLFFFTEFPQ